MQLASELQVADDKCGPDTMIMAAIPLKSNFDIHPRESTEEIISRFKAIFEEAEKLRQRLSMVLALLEREVYIRGQIREQKSNSQFHSNS